MEAVDESKIGRFKLRKLFMNLIIVKELLLELENFTRCIPQKYHAIPEVIWKMLRAIDRKNK